MDGTTGYGAVSYKETADWTNVNDTIKVYQQYLNGYGEIAPKNMDYLHAIYIGWIHENLVQMYLGLVTIPGEYLYRNLIKLLGSETFRESFMYQTSSSIYHNLKNRKGILSQMDHFMTICQYAVNDLEFIRMVKREIQKLIEEIQYE